VLKDKLQDTMLAQALQVVLVRSLPDTAFAGPSRDAAASALREHVALATEVMAAEAVKAEARKSSRSL
jgi:hypothetical protein